VSRNAVLELTPTSPKANAPRATEIAKRIKDTRDRTLVQTVDVGGRQVTVNRTNAINWLGSAWNTGEENYLYHKMCRAMGVINLDHCARL
jgi:formate dehydrogenase major subunit